MRRPSCARGTAGERIRPMPGPCSAAIRSPPAWPQLTARQARSALEVQSRRTHGFEATAVIVDGVVYIGDLDGDFYAVDSPTAKSSGRSTPTCGFTAAAAVRDGRVYVGDNDGQFYCFDTADRQAAVEASKPTAEINCRPNFYKDNVLFGSQDATLYCLERRHRREGLDTTRSAIRFVASRRWSKAARFWPAAMPSCTSSTWKRAKRSPRVEIDGPTGSTPAGRRYACLLRHRRRQLLCHRLARGQGRLGDAHRHEHAAALRQCGRSMTGGRDLRRPRQTVYALDPKTGKECGRFATRSRVDSSPVIVGDRVFVGSSDGRLYALDRKTRQEGMGVRSRRRFHRFARRGRRPAGDRQHRRHVYCFGAKTNEPCEGVQPAVLQNLSERRIRHALVGGA